MNEYLKASAGYIIPCRKEGRNLDKQGAGEFNHLDPFNSNHVLIYSLVELWTLSAKCKTFSVRGSCCTPGFDSASSRQTSKSSSYRDSQRLTSTVYTSSETRSFKTTYI